MQIRQIELSQFRNYDNQIIDVAPGINVFFGDNAQGKTNILEAVYLCACARSHRTSRDMDMIRKQSDQYKVRLAFINQSGYPEEITIHYLDAVPGLPQRMKASRIVYHNGSKLERIGDLMGLFHAVIFAPEDLMLVKEGPATRRRYLDLLISQVRPAYFLALQNYTRLLTQRNKLLKDLREKWRILPDAMDEQDAIQMDVWNQSLSESAATLIEQRSLFSARISDLAGKAQERISSGQEKLFVRYRTVSGIKAGMGKDQIRETFLQKLQSSLKEDFEKGTTGSGPHRDDLELSLDGEGVKPFASQGQQRSAVLSMKLAELAILRQDTGEAPVLLLDDVMSELDENRRTSLLENIHDAQVFVTCTDARQVVREIRREQMISGGCDDNLNRFTFYQVTNGQVTSIQQDG